MSQLCKVSFDLGVHIFVLIRVKCKILFTVSVLGSLISMYVFLSFAFGTSLALTVLFGFIDP